MGWDNLASSGILLEVRCDAEYFGLAGLAKEAVRKESEKMTEKERVLIKECARKAFEVLEIEFKGRKEGRKA